MSRLAGLLLLLLVCSRSPSNADLIHALAKHPVVPETTDTIFRVAGAKKPENKFAHAESGAEHDDRRSKNMADDDDAAVQRQLTDNEYRDSDASKRNREKYSPQAWEKRRWNAANSRAAWGKRDAAVEDGEQNWRQSDLAAAWNKLHQEAAAGKRRWGAHSGMAAWGKRSRPHGRPKRSVGDGNDEVALSPYFVDDEQRQLVPVKRQWRTMDSRYGGPKRKWEYNTMKTWGKRPAVWPHHLEDHVDGRIWPKRRWSSDNALRVWG